MTYVLHIRVDDVSFGDKAGAARSKFYAEDDTLRVEVDLTRIVNSEYGRIVAHEIAHHLDGLSPYVDNGPELPLEDRVNAKLAAVTNPFVKPRSLIPDEETPTSTPEQMKDFNVMLRRTTKQFASTTVEAVDAEDAVRLARTLTVQPEPGGLAWDSEDDATPVDWVHAELCTSELTEGETSGETYAEWEEPKLSPGKLVEALNLIQNRVVTINMGLHSKRDMLQALQYVDNIARNALADMVPGDE